MLYEIKRESPLNPFLIGGYVVKFIQFYDGDQIIAQTQSGWVHGTNNIGDSAIESLQVTKAQANGYTGHHFIPIKGQSFLQYPYCYLRIDVNFFPPITVETKEYKRSLYIETMQQITYKTKTRHGDCEQTAHIGFYERKGLTPLGKRCETMVKAIHAATDKEISMETAELILRDPDAIKQIRKPMRGLPLK